MKRALLKIVGLLMLGAGTTMLLLACSPKAMPNVFVSAALAGLAVIVIVSGIMTFLND